MTPSVTPATGAVAQFSRRALLVSAASLGIVRLARADDAPVVVGVSGPLTGQYAQYGADWQRGFDLALEEINARAGIGGRKLEYQFEDSQGDPRQAVAIAQKLVADPRIVIELGDFSSAASMAASPIYQRGTLVQFGFTNSHPDFTKSGDYMWSNAPNQTDDMPVMADFAVTKLGLKQLGVAYVNNDWGRTSKDIVVKAVQQFGGEVVAAEAYLPDEKDFRSTLVRLRDADPTGIALVAYYPDGAQIMRQLRALDMYQPVVAAASVYSPKFLELGGSAVEGVYTNANFFAGDTRPEVRNFVTTFTAKFGTEPGSYTARAYDAMILAATVMREYGVSRKAVHDGLAQVRDVPSVVFGKISFDPATRRVKHPASVDLVVKNGAFALWDGTRPTAG
jgi:branched-chain amino acid transport system substrate-binding protein